MFQLRYLLPTLCLLGSLATDARAGNPGPVMANGYTVQVEIAACVPYHDVSHCHLWWQTVFTSEHAENAAQVALLFELAIEYGFVAEILPEDITFNQMHEALRVRVIHIDLSREQYQYQPRLPTAPPSRSPGIVVGRGD